MQSSGLETNPPITEEKSRLEALVSRILDEARVQGADAAEVGVSDERGLSLTVRLGEVETLEYTRSGGFGVTVFVAGSKGHASTSDTRPEAIRDTVRAALEIARHTAVDPCAGLAETGLLATDIPDLDLYHPWDLDVERATGLACACEEAGRAVDARIGNSDGATVNTHETYRLYANSNGFFAGYPGTRHSLSCVLIARDGQGMQRDYWYDASRDPARLAGAVAIGRRAGERTVARLDSRSVATGEMPVLFAPEVASSLIGHFLGAISGGALYRRASFLLDRLGQPVFPDWFAIDERPHIRGGNGSAAFDGDGLPTRAQHFVEGGVLKTYALGLYAARRLEMPPTGNGSGTHNVHVATSGQTQAELMARMGTGILVTELMGQGVNGVTGDYSRGASGFAVIGGRIAHPVSGITIAGNLNTMFRSVAAVADDPDPRGNIHCGSLLIPSMMVAAEG